LPGTVVGEAASWLIDDPPQADWANTVNVTPNETATSLSRIG